MTLKNSPSTSENSITKPIQEISNLRQLEACGCEVAQALLETPEVQQGFEIVKSMRRLGTLYNIPPPDIYFQRKADVEFESNMFGNRIGQSLRAVQELCYTYYPLAEFKAKIGHRLASLENVNTDPSDTEMLAKEMVDRIIWRTVNLDFSNVPEAAAKLSATVAANLNHIDDQLRERARRNLELGSDEYISSLVSNFPGGADGHARRSESTQIISRAAESVSYRMFTNYIATLETREQISVLIWLDYFQSYPNLKSALYGLKISTETYRVGLASVAKKIVGAFDGKEEPPKTFTTMTKLASKITSEGLYRVNGRLVKLGSSLERVIFWLEESNSYPNNLTPVELQTISLLDKHLRASNLPPLRDIALELDYNVKSVQKIVRKIARKL